MLARLACLTALSMICTSTLTAAEPTSKATHYWQLGQQALHRGESRKAIEFFEESLAADPHLTRNYLSLAAAHLGENREARACVYLTLYVAAHPEHVVIRGHYAELLQRLNRFEEARTQYEQFLSNVQENDALAAKHLVHCHSRLMQIAESLGFGYDEHLHRGIGLLLLARDRAALSEPEEKLSMESLLCRAAGELTLARQLRPEQARPCWYLREVWRELVQSHPAKRSLRIAVKLAPFSYLTPTERRELHLATGSALAPK